MKLEQETKTLIHKKRTNNSKIIVKTNNKIKTNNSRINEIFSLIDRQNFQLKQTINNRVV